MHNYDLNFYYYLYNLISKVYAWKKYINIFWNSHIHKGKVVCLKNVRAEFF